MYAICDNQNIVRRFAASIAWVTAQTNGVTVGTAQDKAQAVYVPEDDTYWPLREVFPGQETCHVFEVETVPEGCEADITRYDCGMLEIDEELKAQADAEKEKAARRERILEQTRAAARLLAEQQTEEATMMMLADLYDPWEAGQAYSEGKILSYGLNANGETQLYRVIQAHTSQEDWKPGAGTESLYKTIGFTEEGYDIWTQPLGAHDAYQTGDVVSHKDKLWESTVDGNVWEPGVVPDVWVEKQEGQG